MINRFKYELVGDSEEKHSKCNENIGNYENTCSSNVLSQIVCGCLFIFIIVMYKAPSYKFETIINNGVLNESIVQPDTTTDTPSYEFGTRINNGVLNASIGQPETTTDTPKQKYYVQTEQCTIPYVDPFTSELRKIYHPPKEENCTADDALVNFVYDLDVQKYLTQINEDVMKKLIHNNSKAVVKCCYREIVRPEGPSADEKYKLLRCQEFHHTFALPAHIDGLIVECRSNAKLIYQDAFSFIQYRPNNWSPKNASFKASTEQPSSSGVNIRKPNVLLIGIDSLSRINIRRTMPKTFAHLVKNRWFELEGYNKIADNTYPNLMALLTGLSQKMGFDVCKPNTPDGLNNCDFIWKLFKNESYRTAYAEDTTLISTFNFAKKGFRHPPTDHYLRPFVLAIQKTLHSTKKYGLKYCVGRRQYGEYIYDNAMEFAKRYNNMKPFFGLFWTNSFSHNDYAAPAMMDTKMREYLLDFERNHILDTTIVIFFSDHGARWGPLLKLPEGYLEERLPMFFIWLPEWFQKRYPEFVVALNINRHRLSSPYDIYVTLKHIIALGKNENNNNNKVAQSPVACPKCQSIFHEISVNRTCADAGIVEHWCTCVSYEVMRTNDTTLQNISKLVATEINSYLAKKNLSSLCRKITLKSVDSAEKLMQTGRSDSAPKQKTSKRLASDGVYRIKFTISQKLAKFQATTFYNGTSNRLRLDVENEISRLNLYANDSRCIDDKEAKKYCICAN